jgi:hypothetical protein
MDPYHNSSSVFQDQHLENYYDSSSSPSPFHSVRTDHYQHPHTSATSSSSSSRSSASPGAANVVGNTVSVTSTARMKTYSVASVPQQTRHARRIYVGGIPPNYIDEDGLRIFLSTVIAQGLREENDHSYVLSVYINHKKCFAFVELKSIELATACLDLDGMIMKNVVLRVLRANEYKPELIPQLLNKVIRFDLSGFQFGSISASSATGMPGLGGSTGGAGTGGGGGVAGIGGNHSYHHHQSIMEGGGDDNFMERTLESIIQFSNLGGLEAGSITIVGFPFDENISNKKNTSTLRGIGCINTPKQFRSLIRKYRYGYIDNPEYFEENQIDLSKMKVLDVGDVLAGKNSEETKSNLSTTISELILRGSVPFVIGGSLDLSYYSISGLLTGSGNRVATIYVSAHGDIKILEDSRFYGSRSPNSQISCQGRYVSFGAQVSALLAVCFCSNFTSFSLSLL